MAFNPLALAGAVAACLLLLASPASAYGRLDIDANPPYARVLALSHAVKLAPTHKFAARLQLAHAQMTTEAHEVLPMCLPAPAVTAGNAKQIHAGLAPDPARLAPPPAEVPEVPSPTAPELLTSRPLEAKTLLGLDARMWRDFGMLAMLGALVGGLVGVLGKAWRRSSTLPTWTARRTRRGPQMPREAEELDASAWAAIEACEWEVALQRLWATLNTRGGSAWAYYHLALAYEALSQETEAEGAYRSAIQIDPGHAPASYNLGVLLDRQGHAGQAAIAYRKLLDAHPDDADALFNLGHLYRELGMPGQAEVHWRAARQIAPRDQDLRRDLGLLHRTLRHGQRRPAA